MVRLVPLILVATVAAVAAVFLATSGDKGKLGPFSGERAYAHVAALVGLGPRHPGSEAIGRARGYISGQLREAGWQTSLQRLHL